jgi:cytochrome b561
MTRFVITAVRHDGMTIALHWATAFLVVLLWGIAQTIDVFEAGDARVLVRSTHILVGIALTGIVAARLIWRLKHRYTVSPANAGLAGLISKVTHLSLYGLLAATLLLGLLNVWVRGDNIFLIIQIPQFDPGNRALRHQIGDLHGLAANAILIVAGGHALAALFHHYVLRDGVLLRILPGEGAGSGGPERRLSAARPGPSLGTNRETP